jgi:hypothetical protein
MGHSRTSVGCSPEHSMHLARIAWTGVDGVFMLFSGLLVAMPFRHPERNVSLRSQPLRLFGWPIWTSDSNSNAAWHMRIAIAAKFAIHSPTDEQPVYLPISLWG